MQDKTLKLICRVHAVVLFGILLFVSSFARAQMDQGSIVGTIQDSTGAVIPNAVVHLENKATGFALDRNADAGGFFVFSPIKIGTYTVSVSHTGFAPVTVDGIVVTAASRVEVPVTLKPGSATTTVQVTSAPPALETDESSTGATISANAIVEMPLLDRNPMFITQMTPGVVPSEQTSRGSGTGDFSANGQRPYQNNYILDGIDNNSVIVDLANGSSYVIKPIPDGIAEFTVQASSYSAEFGHGGGAVVNVSTKSGANQLHGSLWEFWRNDILNARDYFETTKPEYRENQFGGTLGGPIIPNKLFIFGDVEANRIIFGTYSLYSIPTLKMRTGDFSELLNPALTGNNPRTLYVPGSAGTVLQQCSGAQNVICPGNVDTLAAKLLSLFPAPNTSVTGQTYNNFNFQAGASDDTIQYDGRLDWNLNSSNQAFARYSNSNEQSGYPVPFGVMGGQAVAGLIIKGRNFTASETHFFSPKLDNEFRFGYNWINDNYLQPNAGTNISATYGLGGVPYGPSLGGFPMFIRYYGNWFGSSIEIPTIESENVAQLLDNVTRVLGKNTLRFGVNFQRILFQALQPPAPRGEYIYTGNFTQIPGQSGSTGYDLADFIQDQMESGEISTSNIVHNQRWYRAAYVQDDWRLSKQLTLNLGLRYEYFQPLEEVSDDQANFVANYSNDSATYYMPRSKQSLTLPSPLLADFAANDVTVAYTGNRSLINAPKGDFAPRVGFAYQVRNDLVVHGGFGLFFGGLESVGFSPNLGLNLPFTGTDTVSSGACTPGACANDGITLETGFASQIAAGLQNSATTPIFHMYLENFKTPVNYAFNLSVQKELLRNTVATLSYVGALDRHLTSGASANAAPLLAPGQNVQANRPFNQFGGSSSALTYDGISSYNAGEATIDHRLSNGLYFLGTYEFSHNLDDDFPPLLNSEDEPRDWQRLGFHYDYGAAADDTRHRFVLNGQYELPLGKGRQFLNQSALLDTIVGGWNVGLLFRVQTGQPQLVTPNNNPTNGGGGDVPAYAVRISNPYSTVGANPGTGVTCATRVRTVASWFNPCAFTNPPVATSSTDIAAYGPRGRQAVYGPGYNRTDMSLSKDFRVFREMSVHFRADLFNVFNTPAYGQPNVAIGPGFGQITQSRFGQSNGGFGSGETPDARVAQLSAKFTF